MWHLLSIQSHLLLWHMEPLWHMTCESSDTWNLTLFPFLTSILASLPPYFPQFCSASFNYNPDIYVMQSLLSSYLSMCFPHFSCAFSTHINSLTVFLSSLYFHPPHMHSLICVCNLMWCRCWNSLFSLSLHINPIHHPSPLLFKPAKLPLSNLRKMQTQGQSWSSSVLPLLVCTFPLCSSSNSICFFRPLPPSPHPLPSYSLYSSGYLERIFFYFCYYWSSPFFSAILIPPPRLFIFFDSSLISCSFPPFFLYTLLHPCCFIPPCLKVLELLFPHWLTLLIPFLIPCSLDPATWIICFLRCF